MEGTKRGPEKKSSFGNKLEEAVKARREFLYSQGIKIESGFRSKLYKTELNSLIGKSREKLGSYKTPFSEKPLQGTVHGYEVLGSGYHLVVKGMGWFTVVKAGGRDPRLEIGKEVQVGYSKEKQRRIYVKGIAAKRERNKEKINLEGRER